MIITITARTQKYADTNAHNPVRKLTSIPCTCPRLERRQVKLLNVFPNNISRSALFLEDRMFRRRRRAASAILPKCACGRVRTGASRVVNFKMAFLSLALPLSPSLFCICVTFGVFAGSSPAFVCLGSAGVADVFLRQLQ